MKCTKCGKTEKDNEFSFLWDIKKYECQECQEIVFAANRKAVEEYDRTTPEEWKHNPGIIFPQ